MKDSLKRTLVSILQKLKSIDDSTAWIRTFAVNTNHNGTPKWAYIELPNSPAYGVVMLSFAEQLSAIAISWDQKTDWRSPTVYNFGVSSSFALTSSNVKYRHVNGKLIIKRNYSSGSAITFVTPLWGTSWKSIYCHMESS